jgi:hypothetical protein
MKFQLSDEISEVCRNTRKSMFIMFPSDAGRITDRMEHAGICIPEEGAVEIDVG